MADYAIGDVQGCYDNLINLLHKINYDESKDQLWFVGDLVNRGPKSLAVLRFIKSLTKVPYITLGNHDLHLLALIFSENPPTNLDDTLAEVLSSPDCLDLAHWLRQQNILVHNPELNVVMCHAGICPTWDLKSAKKYAKELESALCGKQYKYYLTHMYGNKPNYWQSNLEGIDRFRSICNYFTRMRFCDSQGNLDLVYKGTLRDAPNTLYPWYAVPNRKIIEADIVFGHWAALEGNTHVNHIHALDTGCVWGGLLTAIRLQDMQRFTVPGLEID